MVAAPDVQTVTNGCPSLISVWEPVRNEHASSPELPMMMMTTPQEGVNDNGETTPVWCWWQPTAQIMPGRPSILLFALCKPSCTRPIGFRPASWYLAGEELVRMSRVENLRALLRCDLDQRLPFYDRTVLMRWHISRSDVVALKQGWACDHG